MNNHHTLPTTEELQAFHKDGYLVVPNWLAEDKFQELQQFTLKQIVNPSEPYELEAELGYPGAPEDVMERGGKTPRRLLGAYQRSSQWGEFATSGKMKSYLHRLFQHANIYLSQAHHNCLMTKFPQYSSDTYWHQDRRYWSFKEPNLITAWLALGNECARNGGLLVIPASHSMQFMPEQLDEKLFFRQDLESNQELLKQAKEVNLKAGDMLFFHCNLLHSASRNQTDAVKLSLVFTYYNGDNEADPETRSSSLKGVPLK